MNTPAIPPRDSERSSGMGARWQDAPDWLIYAVRRHHAAAMTEGHERAGEEAVRELADRALADDPAFARLVIERYVRALIRAPKPRKRGKSGARERLMADCARMDAEGMSLRGIGEAVGLSYEGVRKILAEWRVRLPEMDAATIAASTPTVNLQPAGLTAQVDAEPNVIPLRRLA